MTRSAETGTLRLVLRVFFCVREGADFAKKNEKSGSGFLKQKMTFLRDKRINPCLVSGTGFKMDVDRPQ